MRWTRGRKTPSHPRGLPNLQWGKTRTAERNRRSRPALAGGKVGVRNKGPPLPSVYKESSANKSTEEKENPTRDGGRQLGRSPERRSTQLRKQISQPLRRRPRLARRVPEQCREEGEVNVEGPTTTTTSENRGNNNNNKNSSNNDNNEKTATTNKKTKKKKRKLNEETP